MSAALHPSFGPPAHPAPDGAGHPRARLRALRPDLPPDGPAFRAALVLLAAADARYNIDRIAARTGVARHWVAACARRLRDNGVWSAGEACVAWTGPEDFRFWNDVGVAEGRLLRRTDARGRTQWAPAGAWAKAYDFVGPASDPGGAVLYMVADDEPPPPAPRPAPAARSPDTSVRLTVERGPAAEPAPRPQAPAFLGAAPLPELFPGTAWLGQAAG